VGNPFYRESRNRFDFGKDFLQIVKDYVDKIPITFLTYESFLHWVWAREFRRNILGTHHYVGMLKSKTEIDGIFPTYRINKRIITF
jgi:hypothetical protein